MSPPFKFNRMIETGVPVFKEIFFGSKFLKLFITSSASAMGKIFDSVP